MPDLTGKTIGRYQILDQLGQGGMATVYKARDSRLEREVAIKVIRTDLFGQAVIERILKRFEREAKALARLTHPNIVPIIDYGDQDGSPYLVMALISGGTLKQALGQRMQAGRGSFPFAEAARLLAPIARALDYAHKEGVLHRDVKPSNILITKSGEVMLTDFGIARMMDEVEGATLTGTGVGVGTPEYMAPEQWLGKAGPSSDQYSLGIVFYEMITGHKPYTADTPAGILLQQAREPLPSAGKYVQNLPAGVEELIQHALAKEEPNRYADMAAFALVLKRLEITSEEVHENYMVQGGMLPVEIDGETIDPLQPQLEIGMKSGIPIYPNSAPKKPYYQEIFDQIKVGLVNQAPSGFLSRNPDFRYSTRNRMQIMLEGITGAHYQITFMMDRYEFALHFESSAAKNLQRRQAFDPILHKISKQVGMKVVSGQIEHGDWMGVWYERNFEAINQERIHLYIDQYSKFIIATFPTLVKLYD